MFSPDSGITVYDRDYWWSDAWNDAAFGRDYDFSRPFFEQYRELLQAAPLPSLANTNTVRSDYGNHNADCKDCYLVYASFHTQNSAYGTGLVNGQDSLDFYEATGLEQCYEATLCAASNRLFFSYDTEQGVQSMFTQACAAVQDCLACINLRNKNHYIWNKPYSKEEYKKELAKYDFGSYRLLSDFKEKFDQFVQKFPRRCPNLLRTVNTTGDHVADAKNCHYCFDGYGETENCKYMFRTMKAKDCYDGLGVGIVELSYEGVDSGIKASSYKFTVYTHSCHNVEYTYACHNSSYLFGCVGLRSKQYCILNKQYSKEEYEALLPRIKKQMEDIPYVDAGGRTYRYGEFFPQEISPFAYNETLAQEHFPLTLEEAKIGSCTWRQPDVKDYQPTIKAADLADHIKDVPDSILQEIIGCIHKGECNEQCTTAFRIIPQELQFLRNFNLALPRLCPNCRHHGRLRQRNPLKLWRRACQCAGERSENGVYANLATHSHNSAHCENEFETTFAPDRTEILYCEQCYQTEVA